MASVNLGERGQTGLAAWSGMVSEAYTSKLHWPDAYGVYDEMRRRDPTIRSILNALVLLARTASWYFEPGGPEEDDKRAAEFCEMCIHNMSHTIEDAIEDALMCVWFGWAWQEICYERISGDKGAYGRLIGWRKWAPRRQSSFCRWEFDKTGGVQALVQRPAPDYAELRIPIEKSLHYVGQRDGNNPEGWALGEACYEPWVFLKNLHIISGIGWDRTFVGLPVFKVEARPSDEDNARMKRIGEALLVGEKQFVVEPEAVTFRLETVHNTNAESLLNQMKYERRTMMQTLLADFLDLGTGQTGSWALGQDKSVLFLMAVDGLLERISGVITRFGVTRLMELNALAFPGMTAPPLLAHKKVEKPSMGQLGVWLQQVSQLLSWTPEDEKWLRTRAGMPVIDVTEVEEEEEEPPEDESPDGDEEPPDGEDEALEEEGELGMSLGFSGSALRSEELGLAELQEADPEVRAGLEGELVGEVEALLEAQEGRVLEAVRDPELRDGLADDEAFWEAETGLMVAALMPALIRILNALGQAEAEALTGLGVEWSMANPQAVAYARSYAFDLITGMNETLQKGTREAMATWGQVGGDVQFFTDLLEPMFGPQRAKAIAGTEITRFNAVAHQSLVLDLGVVYAIQPPTRTNCRCWTAVETLPDGTLVGVWQTAADDLVSKAKRVSTPWGEVVSDRDLHGVIVSEGPWLGRSFNEVAREVRANA